VRTQSTLYRLPSEVSEPPKRLRPQRTSFEWAERQAWTAEYPGRDFREIGVSCEPTCICTQTATLIA
jgi:hypothetical protein